MKGIIIVCFGLCSFAGKAQLDVTSEFDSLGKYSYLLLGIKFRSASAPPGVSVKVGSDVIGNSTGFFVRKNNKLYLVSAFHVFSGCEVYRGTPMNVIADELLVVYKDTINITRGAVINLWSFQFKKCGLYLKMPDVDMVDVTDWFHDAKINSVEEYLPSKFLKTKSIDSNKYVSYGFPGDQWIEYIKTHSVFEPKSFSYIGSKVDSTNYHLLDKLYNPDSLYTIIKPALHPGASGSPVFKMMVAKRKKKKYIQFAGIQSGTNFLSNYSYIVKPEELEKIMIQLK